MLTTAWGPVGTRGGCGAGWGPGACPDGNAIHWGLRGANSSHPNQDQHQALSSTPPRPLSLQDPGPQAPQPGQAPGPLIHSTPPLVPTGPWAASISMDRIPRVGRQHSVGLDLAGGEERSSSFEPCLSEHTYEEVNQGFAGKGIFVTLVSFVSLVSLV